MKDRTEVLWTLNVHLEPEKAGTQNEKHLKKTDKQENKR